MNVVILLTRGLLTIVSEIDADLALRKWQANDRGRVVGGKPQQTLARVIGARMGFTKPFVDHIDGDTLNNLRSNLRECTRYENSRNKKKEKNGTSRFKGVFLNSKRPYQPWHAQIQFEHRVIFLGRYTDEVEAALVYDTAARKYFGEFAKPNFPLTKASSLKPKTLEEGA